jgi:hypothetical protein
MHFKRTIKNSIENFNIKKEEDIYIISIISLLCSLIFSIFVYILLKGKKQLYHDLVVGNITWIDHHKSIDYITIYTLIITMFLIIIFLMISNIKFVKQGFEVKNSLVEFFLIGLVIFSLTQWFMRGEVPRLEYLILLTLVSTYFVLYKNGYCDERKIIYTLLILVLGNFSYYSLLVAINVFYPNIIINNYDVLNNVYYVWLVILAFIIICYFYTNQKNNKYIIRTICLLQLPIPFINLIIMNDNYIYQGEVINLYIPLYTKASMLVICGAIFLYIVVQCKDIFKKGENTLLSINNLIFTPTLLSISLFINYSNPGYSAFLRDDFHLGEIAIPWQQFFDFGQVPYFEFVSVQGLLGVSVGAINDIIFGGNYSTFLFSINYLYIFILLLVTYVLTRLIGKGWILLLAIFGISLFDRYYLAILFILILALPKLISKPRAWLMSWLFLSIFNILFMPAIGAAVVVASLPFVFFMIAYAIREGEYNSRFIISFLTIALLIVIVLWNPFLTGIFQYIIENGSTNTEAYGIGLFQNQGGLNWFPRIDNPIIHKAIWELFRIGSWTIGITVLASILLIVTQKLLAEKNYRGFVSPIIFINVTTILFVILLISYTMGRIDPGITRLGVVSLIMLSIILPVSLIFSLSHVKNKLIPIVLISIVLGVNFSFSHQDLTKLNNKAISNVRVPDNLNLINGVSKGIPKLGTMFISENKLKELLAFKNITDDLLGENETYFDLTNKSAYYFIFDRKVPGVYSADYLANNEIIQNRVLDQLISNDVPIIWLSPNIRHDGGPTSLRSYRIYKWLMENEYIYYYSNGIELLVEKVRLLNYLDNKQTQITPANILPSIELWNQRFSNADKLIVNNTLKLLKEDKGWFHTYATVDLDEKNKYFYTLESVVKTISGSRNAYIHIEYYDGNDELISTFSSPGIFTNGNHVGTFITPEKTSYAQFGLVLHEETYGEFSFENILLFMTDDLYNNESLLYKYEMHELSRIFHQKDLRSIPSAWGRNYNNLKQRFNLSEFQITTIAPNHLNAVKENWYGITGDDPYLIWNVEPVFNGREYDFILINIEFNKEYNDNLRGQIFWSGPSENFKESNSFKYDIKENQLLIPLGSHPHWNKNNITKIRFDIDNFPSGLEFKISSVELINLVQ